MNFINIIKDNYKNIEIDMFVDMDGVITDYDLIKELDFKTKRPLFTNINTLKEISKLKEINLFILSICKKDYQIEEKNDWLNKYAPFFKKENRVIISKESNPNIDSKDLKYKFLEKYAKSTNRKVILIDDDNEILKHIKKGIKNIDLYQDSSLID